jgi:predicted secreted protein
MAEHKPIAGSILLLIDPAGGTSYNTVVCLTSIERENEVAVIDADSACGPSKEPGLASFSLSAEAYHMQDPDSGKISGADLRALMLAKTTVGYKVGPASPVTGDEVETGTAFIASLSDSYSFNEAATFSLTLQPKGTPTFTITV